MPCTIGPYEVTRGEILPYRIDAKSPQAAVTTRSGAVYVAERPFQEQFFSVKLSDSRALLMEVFDFIRYGCRFRAVPFTYIDGRGTSWLVRYWGRNDIRINDEGVQATMTLVLRKEV